MVLISNVHEIIYIYLNLIIIIINGHPDVCTAIIIQKREKNKDKIK